MSSTKRILRNYGEDKKAHGKVLRDLLCWLLSKKCESTSTQFFMENPSPTLRCALNNSLQLCFMLFMQKKNPRSLKFRPGQGYIFLIHMIIKLFTLKSFTIVVSIFCKLRSKYIHLLANNALNMCISATSIWAILIYGTSGHLDMQIMPQH